jgi:hypothetical protein
VEARETLEPRPVSTVHDIFFSGIPNLLLSVSVQISILLYPDDAFLFVKACNAQPGGAMLPHLGGSVL